MPALDFNLAAGALKDASLGVDVAAKPAAGSEDSATGKSDAPPAAPCLVCGQAMPVKSDPDRRMCSRCVNAFVSGDGACDSTIVGCQTVIRQWQWAQSCWR
jgi:hypothetical protein